MSFLISVAHAADAAAPAGAPPGGEYMQFLMLAGFVVIFYLTDVASRQVYTLSYRLLARYPIRAQTPPSIAYDYYTPDTSDNETPERVVVTLGTPNR